MGCHEFLLHLLNTGTPACPSEQLSHRVVWTNACALIISILGGFHSALHFATNGMDVLVAVIICVYVIQFPAVLGLNKFGQFKISRCVVIITAIIGPTLTGLSNSEVSNISFVLMVPLAMSSTLFDPTSYILWVPLSLLTGVCYAGLVWVNMDGPIYVRVIRSLLGLGVMLFTSLSLHVLAMASRHDREQELAQTVVDLQSEIDARKVVEESLRKASRAKQEFLATMSHEIRTPMNGVVASADLLSDTPLNAEQQDLADTIKSSALALITIINDILDFSKIEAGQMTIESIPFNVRGVVEQVLDCLAPKAYERGVELVCDVSGPLLSDGVVLSDPGRFRQLLMNILGNAVKFTHVGHVVVYAQLLSPLPDPSHPASSIPASDQQDDDGGDGNDGENSRWLLQVEVEDTGEGIPNDHLESMFEEFTQADTSISRRHGGTGLGLAISKKLVELMGGSIGVKSQLGQGTTFVFSVLVERSGGDETGSSGTMADPSPAVDSPPVLPALMHASRPSSLLPLSPAAGDIRDEAVVVVVWEPLARARDALCRLLRYHYQLQQQEELEGGQMELVVRSVSSRPGLTAVIQVLDEEAQQDRRSFALVCDYRTLLRSRRVAHGDTRAGQKKEQQQHWDVLCGLLQRLDAGVVLLGPCSHRSGVEAGIESKCESALSQPPPRPLTMEGPDLEEDGGRRLADLFHPSRCWCEIGCSGESSATPRWGYVNKPVHQAALLRTLGFIFKLVPSSREGGGGGVIGVGAMKRQQLDDDKVGVVPPRGGRVLVVEDNKVNQKMMGKMLSRLGLPYDIVENGQLAVEALRPHIVGGGGSGGGGGCLKPDDDENEEKPQCCSYSVVLMDCHMPLMDGYEATAAIRQLESAAECTEASGTEETKGGATAAAAALEGVGVSNNCSTRVPIIAVTASVLEEELQRCRDVGMNYVLAKPVRLKELSGVLDEAFFLKKRGHQQNKLQEMLY